MCGMATFTIDVSISSSIGASETAIATRYLYLYLSISTTAPGGGPERSVTSPDAAPGWSALAPMGGSALFLHVDLSRYRHPRTQRLRLAASFRDRDAHRHSLHDLGEVA